MTRRLERCVARGLSIIIAVIAMLAVPASQLRLVTVKVECCCPDPASCHCADHDKSGPDQPTLKACHKNSETITSVELPSFTRPDVASIDVSPQIVASVEVPHDQPHEPPFRERPPGPS